MAINDYLGKSLTSGDFGSVAGMIGAGSDLSAGTYGNYSVTDNGNGTRTVNYNEPSISMSDLGPTATDYAKTLNSNEDAAFNEYKMAANAQEKPLDIYNKLSDKAGIPGLTKTSTTLQGQVNDLEDAIKNAESQVNATTQNSLVTEGQRSGLINAARKPLQENLSTTSTALGRVSNAITAAKSDIGNMTSLALQGQQMALEPYKAKIEMVSAQSARLMTGFTADRETQLNILLDKIHRQQVLSDREWQQAADLSKLEKTYQMEKDNAVASTQLVEVGGHKKLINSQTGAVIADLGSTSSGVSGTDIRSLLGAPDYGTANYQDMSGNVWEIIP